MLKECPRGPWTAKLCDHGFWQIDAGPRAVASIAFSYAHEAEANARLIAAAPEMALVNWAREHGFYVTRRRGTGLWEIYRIAGDVELASGLPDNGFDCPALPPGLFARLRAEMEAGG